MRDTQLKPTGLAPYVLGVALIAAPLLATLVLPDPVQLLVPLVAFGVGVLLRPARAWLVALLVYLLLAGTVLIVMATGHTLPKETENAGRALGDYAFNTVMLALYVAAVVLFPVWLGRRLSRRVRARFHRTPATA
ncbi:MAG: hypothetical protein DCC58_17570 [Chloroflexi bacterium]|nr:MAG: hypothetical protein DCC58_17570 [Chloroflexota bacterium]